MSAIECVSAGKLDLEGVILVLGLRTQIALRGIYARARTGLRRVSMILV